ncbi:hypothetical protein ACFL2O_10070 [Thermodesulfobacteriota bacterium]
MNKKSGYRKWLLVATIVLILAGLGYYFFFGNDIEKKPTTLLPPTTSTSETEPQTTTSAVEPEKPAGPVERKPIEQSFTEKEIAGPERPSLEEQCAKTEKNLQDFLIYLDRQKYIQNLKLGMDTRPEFKKIISRLSSRAPIPAGESRDSKILIKNLYHLFRVLDLNDIYFIKEVLSHEKDTIEFHFRMLSAWLAIGEQCQNPDNPRPTSSVLYKYAGFFLNTTGGRACLSRRAPEIRLLISYYSILIIHQADRLDKNSYGIDVQPHIIKLKDEISHYTNFEFQKDYLNKLEEINSYYHGKRN